MKKTIISAPFVFTNSDDGLLESGAALVEDGIIGTVGNFHQMKTANPNAEIINFEIGLLTPGLVNLHHHLYSSFARGWAGAGKPSANFREILENIWWHLDEALNLDDIYYSAMIGLCESILSGVTTVADHHSSQTNINGSLSRIAEAFDAIGLRGSICFELSDRKGNNKFREGMNETLIALEKLNSNSADELLNAMVGLHASMTLSNDSLKNISEATRQFSPGYHFHLAEDKIDQDDSIAKYGIRAAERFAKYGLLNNKSLVIHGVHLDKNEIELVKSSGANLILCPRSNQNNSVGLAEWWKYDGVNIGLGTDGIGSDIIQEAKSALYLTHHLRKDSNFGFDIISKMLIEENPIIFNKIACAKIGKIAPGYSADLVLWPYNPPTPLTNHNIYAHYMYGLANQKADSVWVNGKQILKDGEFLSFDYNKILEQARMQAEMLWERI